MTRQPETNSDEPGRSTRVSLMAMLAFVILVSACFKDSETQHATEGPTECTESTLSASPKHDYIGIRNLSIEPTTPTAGGGFTIHWDRTATFFDVDDDIGYNLWPGNAALGITLEGEGASLPLSTTIPFNYAFPDDPNVAVVPVFETVDIETLFPNAVTDLPEGAYTLRFDLAGTDHHICTSVGSSLTLILDFTIGEGSGCGDNVDLLDLVVSDLAYNPLPPRTVSWNVAYNVESQPGSTIDVTAATTETATLVDPTTDAELGSTTINTVGDDSMMAGDFLIQSRTLNDFGVSGQQLGNQVIIRVEITTTTPNAECGADDLDINNVIEILVNVQ